VVGGDHRVAALLESVSDAVPPRVSERTVDEHNGRQRIGCRGFARAVAGRAPERLRGQRCRQGEGRRAFDPLRVMFMISTPSICDDLCDPFRRSPAPHPRWRAVDTTYFLVGDSDRQYRRRYCERMSPASVAHT
jgi:hypothetical protein